MAFLMILAAIAMWGGGIIGLMQTGPLFLITYNTPLWIGGAILFVLGIALSRTKNRRKSRIRVDVNTRDR